MDAHTQTIGDAKIAELIRSGDNATAATIQAEMDFRKQFFCHDAASDKPLVLNRNGNCLNANCDSTACAVTKDDTGSNGASNVPDCANNSDFSTCCVAPVYCNDSSISETLKAKCNKMSSKSVPE